jgi:hypothetical protein
MSNRTYVRAATLVALLACGIAVRAQQADTQPEQQPGASTAKSEADDGKSRIVLKEALARDEPAAFAREVSALLGVAEVRFPSSVAGRLEIPAGKWSAESLLDCLAMQMQPLGPTQKQMLARWERVFHLDPTTKERPASVPKLESLGNVTLQERGQRLGSIAATVVRGISRCRVEMARRIAGDYTFECKDAPLEWALARLGAQAGLSLSTAIEFRVDSVPDAVVDPAAIKALEAQAQDSQAVLGELALLNDVSSALGRDPLDPGFNWAGVDSSVWDTLGFDTNAVARFREWTVDQINAQEMVLSLSQKLLSGAFGEFGNVDPDTGKLRDNPPPQLPLEEP